MKDNYVLERWRQPVVPLAEYEDDTVIEVVNGKERYELRSRFKPSDIERFRTGYVCLVCREPHEHPFPEQCQVCGFPMREKQAESFQRQFKGVERDRRAVLIENELDALDDKHERRFHKTKSGIIVPASVKE